MKNLPRAIYGSNLLIISVLILMVLKLLNILRLIVYRRVRSFLIRIMKKLNIRPLAKFFNIQRMAILFFILLIITAYSVTFKGNNPIELQKQKLISVVKNHQDKGISTLVITALPIWAAVKDRLANEEN